MQTLTQKQTEILASFRKIYTVEFDAGKWWYYEDESKGWFVVPLGESEIPHHETEICSALAAHYDQ